MKLFISIAISCFLISGISFKDSLISTVHTPPAAPVDKTINMEALTDSRGWKLYRVTSDKPCDTNNDGVMSTEIVPEMPICSLDDTLFIKKGNKALYKRGVECYNESKNNTYDWTLTGNTFTMSQGNIQDPMEIVSVDKKRLVMTTKVEALGELYLFTITFIH